MRIACLHTADSNIAVFERAAADINVSLVHEVRSDLLAAAERAGGLTPGIADDTVAALLSLASRADAVVLTCSTLGPAVDGLRSAPAPILRADQALADRALAAGKTRIVVLCAIVTTVTATSALFGKAAERSAVSVDLDVRLIEGAWAHFKAGRLAECLDAVARAADLAFVEGAEIVALGQASMSGAADLTEKGRPLTSPGAALAMALEAAKT